MPRRVLMLTTDARPGGIQTAIRLYARALDQLGWPCGIMAPPDAPIARFDDTAGSVSTPAPLAWRRFAWGLGGPIVRAVRAADVIVTHNNRLIAPARRAGRPVLAIAHGDKSRKLDAATRVVALSRSFADHLVAGGLPPERIMRLPHALPPGAGPIPRRPRAGPPTVLAAGRFVAKKGFSDWIAAAGELQAEGCDARFVLAGDGELGQSLRRQAEAVGAVIAFAGWQPMRTLLADADVFCLPSHDEPFGLVLLEAMAAGVACVATRTHGPLDLIEDGLDGRLVPIGEPRVLAQAMRGLIQDAGARRALAEAARTKANGPAFTVATFAEQFARALEATVQAADV